jgi:thiol:disulfide interchange protein DsbD
MMLGLAIWMLDRVVPPEITMALTGVLLVVSGIYMGALDKINEEAGGWGRFWKSIGLIMLFYGAMQLFGVAAGSHSLRQPLKGIFGANAVAAATETNHLSFQRVKGVEGFEQALAQAKTQNRPVMLDFYADWCVSCKEMENTTFKDTAIIEVLKQSNILLLQADVTPDDAQDKAINKHFGLFGPPQVLFFKADGTEDPSVRLAGYEKPDSFLERVKHFLQNH